MNQKTQSYAFRRNIMFFHISNAILVLFALVSIYVTHKNTSHFREGFVNFRASRMNNTASTQENFFRYNFGTFDLETWACELQDVRGAVMVRDDYGKQCGVEIAGRAIMIPFMITAWAVAAVSLWGFVGGGRRGPDGERMKTDEVGLEMGKMNATDD
jgi:succinate dehydrogenase hydrophobic anchor subunit